MTVMRSLRGQIGSSPHCRSSDTFRSFQTIPDRKRSSREMTALRRRSRSIADNHNHNDRSRTYFMYIIAIILSLFIFVRFHRNISRNKEGMRMGPSTNES
ncbi:unnamed protein product [Nippostrongylus brasiliensis]|uniref:Transmembrane protein n=1 Tax=Nippostrongylus brasiliensis TaxID=27835 RepID=A0A0N4YXI3_NIPBR|nr:unnamed protein product [Nippostrongylus brasiliensis]